MSDTIMQSMGFDASQALQAMQSVTQAMDAMLASFQRAPGVFKSFNANSKGVATSIRGIAPASVDAAAGMDRMGKSARGQMNAWESLITAHGRFSTSISLLSRVVFTQAIVSGFHAIRREIGDAIADAKELNATLSRVRSISGTGNDQSTRASTILAKSYGLSITDAAKALETSLQINDNWATSLQYTNAAAELAVITNGTMEDSIGAVSAAVESGLLPLAKLQDGIGKMAEAVKLGKIETAGLDRVFGNLSGGAISLGITFEELLASITAQTASGITDARAVTNLGNAMKAVARPSAEMAQAIQASGFASGKAMIQALGFIGAIDRLRKFAGGNTDLLNRMFGQQTGLRGIEALVGNEKALARVTDHLRSISSATIDVADAMLQIIQSDAFVKFGKDINKAAVYATRFTVQLVKDLDAGMDAVKTLLTEGNLYVDEFFKNLTGQRVGGVFNVIENNLKAFGLMEMDPVHSDAFIAEQEKLTAHQARLQKTKELAQTAATALEAVHATAVEEASARINKTTKERTDALKKFVEDTKKLTADLLKTQQVDPNTTVRDLKSDASRLFDQGNRTGNVDDVIKARELFEQARELSQSSDDPRVNSAIQLREITREQLRLEGELQQQLKASRPDLMKKDEPLNFLQEVNIPAKFDASSAYATLQEQVSKSPITIPVNFSAPNTTKAWTGGYFNSGGKAQGSDTIPAMLSPGEFVVNSKSSRRFFSQLNSMNSMNGRNSGVGDIHFSMGDINNNHPAGDSYNARQIAAQLERLRRRRVIR